MTARPATAQDLATGYDQAPTIKAANDNRVPGRRLVAIPANDNRLGPAKELPPPPS